MILKSSLWKIRFALYSFGTMLRWAAVRKYLRKKNETRPLVGYWQADSFWRGWLGSYNGGKFFLMPQSNFCNPSKASSGFLPDLKKRMSQGPGVGGLWFLEDFFLLNTHCNSANISKTNPHGLWTTHTHWRLHPLKGIGYGTTFNGN